MKRWVRADGSKTESAMIFNEHFPNEKTVLRAPPILDAEMK